MATEKYSLFKRLEVEHQARNWRRPLLCFALWLVLGSIAAIAISCFAPQSQSFKLCLQVLCSTFAAGLLSFALMAFLSRQEKPATAKQLDSETKAKNRLEASLEMLDGANPLREAQAEEASGFYSRQRAPIWPLLLVLLLAIIIFLLAGQTALLVKQYGVSKKAIAKEQEEKKKVEEEKKLKDKAPDFAEMALSAPESEIRAKPIDEIIWEGSTNSSCGFTSICLEASVNGAKPVSLAMENAPLKKTGESQVTGEMLLEELKVVPFDVVSYNLRGTAPLDGRPDVEIVSVPQFIEVRPFREEAIIMSAQMTGEGAKLMKMLNMLSHFLRMQLALNKAVFVARASGLPSDSPVLREQVELIAGEQQDLRKELDKFLTETPAEEISANAFDCLKQSLAAMDEACRRFGVTPKPASTTKGKANSP
ncbi:MAG TPA: hypothetical protein DCZ94_16800 [Lentisphaeria bacterium]|nr:MAG: hypothetical protein A2X48_16730 [Lentisphaerae bacterium GWF2_49_21]HBC88608.1 hypothetical protein [Lentisphaeria bacterium]